MEILVRFITWCGINMRTYLWSEMPNGKMKKNIGTFLLYSYFFLYRASAIKSWEKSRILSIPQIYSDAVQLCSKFWDTQYVFRLRAGCGYAKNGNTIDYRRFFFSSEAEALLYITFSALMVGYPLREQCSLFKEPSCVRPCTGCPSTPPPLPIKTYDFVSDLRKFGSDL